MNTIEQILTHKERELEDYLARLEDPTLRQLLSDIASLKRAKELLASASPAAPSHAAGQNGHSPTSATPTTVISQGDATEEILRKAGKSLSVEDVLKEFSQYGMTPQRENLISALRKDRRKRFSVINGVVSFRGNQAPPSNGHSATSLPNASTSALARMGFSLIGSIKELLPQLNGEFSQPIVYKMLRERNPEVASLIQKASVATTLRKLQEDGLIEVTYKGFGSEPRRYKTAAA